MSPRARGPRTPEPTVIDAEAVRTVVVEAPQPKPEPQPATFDDLIALGDEIPFFEFLARLSDADWERHLLYLYRLEPAVQNAGKYAFIDKYSMAIDESDIKRDHGGGKYSLQLNNSKSRSGVRSHIFGIAGEPKFQPGQTLRDTGQAPGTPPANSNADLAGVLREILPQVLAATKEKNLPPDQAIQIVIDSMKSAQSASIELMKNSLAGTQGSMTGNPLMDKLLERTIANLDAPKQGSKLEEILLAKLVKDLTEEEREPAPNPTVDDGAGQLAAVNTLIKELGVGENLASVIKGGSKPSANAWMDKLAEALFMFASKAPELFQQYRQMKQEDFQRAVQGAEAQLRIAAVRAQLSPVQTPAPVPTPAPAPGTAPATQPSPGPLPAAPDVLSAVQPMTRDASAEDQPDDDEGPIDEQAEALGYIADCFDLEANPRRVASQLTEEYPALIAGLRLIASDPNGQPDLKGIREFAKATEPLSQYYLEDQTAKRFDKFLQGFVAQIFELPAPSLTAVAEA